MWSAPEAFRLNSVIPDVWIIEEKLRRERERRKKDGAIPLELPISRPQDDGDISEREEIEEDKSGRVVIIDL